MGSVAAATGTLAQARDAVSQGDWRAALELLEAADRDEAGSPEGLETLATAAYGIGDLEAAVSAWEDLHALYARRGDAVGSARAATMVAVYLMMDTGLMAPVRGWVGRADRLLAEHDETPVHALLAMVRTYERFMCGDMDGAREWAHRAIEMGTRHGVGPAVALGRVAAARVRILDGHVEEGLRLLDEVAVTLVSRELDPLTVGMVWCELICAMQGLAQYDRAEEWTEAMEHWRRGTAFGGINGRCRVHRAEILHLRGSCDEAEEEALGACEDLRPWMRREYGWPLTVLGAIRLRKGDIAGAEQAFVAAHENAWDPQPGLALVRLAQGDVAAAATMVREALAHPFDIPSKERPPFGELRRAPLLDAQVEIAVAADDVSTARAAAHELTGIAVTFRSRALMAGAALARGRVALAQGDVARCVEACEQAVAGWIEIGAPYEAAVARMVLGEAHRAGGNEACAQLEWSAARSAFEGLGARRWAGRAAEAERDGAVAVSGTRAMTAPRNIFRCDGDTRTVVFGGATVLLRDLKGLRYLARLLAEPGREFHVLDLVAMEAGSLPTGRHPTGPDLVVSDGGDAGFLLDDQARAAYRRRLAEIEQDIDEATLMNDPERAALAKVDRDYLVGELSRAVGLGGRARRAGSACERARSSVTRTLRYALSRIGEHHPALASHLEHAVRTGTYCCYAPDPTARVAWDVEDRGRRKNS